MESDQVDNSEFLYFEEMKQEYQEDDPLPLEPAPLMQQKRKRKSDFTSDEKKKLALLIKYSEPIWKLNHRLHKNNSAVASLWQKISVEMKKPVEDCKGMWRSLRDSMRYHASVKKKQKSFREADVSLEVGEKEALEDGSTIDWEFAACMSFLPPLLSRKKRRIRTFNSSDIESDSPRCSNQTSMFGNAFGGSNYAYINENQNQKDDPLLETDLSKNICDLSKNICQLIDYHKQRAATATPLKNFAMLANLDRMLEKLPEDVVEDLHVRFTSQIYDEIKKLRNKNK